jgi:alkylated DNA repair dioxygenase AlkB
MRRQLALFDRGDEPGFDAGFAGMRRLELAEGAWVEHLPGWVSGHEALFDHLEETTRWRSERRVMYQRRVDVPRLVAGLPGDGAGHPVLEAMRFALSERYREPLVKVSLALYRDGRDSVAFHGDTTARDLPEALVATVSLGAPRGLQLRPAAGGESIVFRLGQGDLLVMGGSCQRTWRHGIPKVAEAGPRIAVMFRPIWQPPPGSR